MTYQFCDFPAEFMHVLKFIRYPIVFNTSSKMITDKKYVHNRQSQQFSLKAYKYYYDLDPYSFKERKEKANYKGMKKQVQRY